ncbi:MAG: tetratricopeptide repeat protein [Afipia sp.]|nr:tetratricopeptide repeat protein [Afipia sp.]
MKVGGGKGSANAGQMFAEAVAAHQAGNLFKARKLYDALIGADKSYVPALHYLGILEAQQKHPEKALRLFDRALAILPNAADILADKGKVLVEIGQHHEALACFEQTVAINPEHWMALQNQGATLLALKRPLEALDVFDRLLVVMRNHPAAFNNRALALKDLGRFPEAVEDFRKAASFDSKNVEILTNLGDSLFAVKNYDDANASYDKALAIRPDLAQAWLGRANIHVALKRYEEAVAAYDQAITHKGDLAEAYHGRGAVLSDHKRFEEAIEDFGKALALKPDILGAEGARLHAKMQICDWRNRESECDHLTEAVREGKPNTSPFAYLGLSSSAADQLSCSRAWTTAKFPSANQRKSGDATSYDKLRIVYLSADFYEHPVAYLMAGMFEAHDRARFETVAVSFGADDGSDMRKRLEKSFDRFVDAQSMAETEIADFIETLQPDIVVDLMGYTGIPRTGVLARRVAPIQISYLGFAGTMGADFIDYILADRYVIPSQHRQFFSEKVAQLPGSFMVNDRARKIVDHATSRSEQGLPEKGFVFCSFNQSYKIAPDVFAIWMRLLKAVEGSVLWLSKHHDVAVRNLQAAAREHGVAPERLVFATRVPLNEDHLARHQLADLFLDTLPFNAHSTAADALWAGLPVLTRAGETFAGRVATSLLTALDLPELITSSADEYESVARELATNANRLAAIRSKLASKRLSAPLFDTVRTTRNIEQAFEAMHKRHRDGLPPDDIEIG